MLQTLTDWFRYLFVPKRPRVSGADPSTSLPCEWCEEVKPTTLEEVWSEVYPAGKIRRLCQECSESCAGG